MGVRTKLQRNLKRLFHKKTAVKKEQRQEPLPSPPPAHHPAPTADTTSPLPLRRRLTDRVVGLHNKIWRKKPPVPVCGCGRPLKAGWECLVCRLTCPVCHRALMEGEECSRCQVVTTQQQLQQSSLSTETESQSAAR